MKFTEFMRSEKPTTYMVVVSETLMDSLGSANFNLLLHAEAFSEAKFYSIGTTGVVL